mmetsp:Transcript_11453/g.48006  ORF Transcript_11453/g.48006 Transcript_11453/m.48006 type:complete len:279 (+) Transcript_11453:1099-1935(+)
MSSVGATSSSNSTRPAASTSVARASTLPLAHRTISQSTAKRSSPTTAWGASSAARAPRPPTSSLPTPPPRCTLASCLARSMAASLSAPSSASRGSVVTYSGSVAASPCASHGYKFADRCSGVSTYVLGGAGGGRPSASASNAARAAARAAAAVACASAASAAALAFFSCLSMGTLSRMRVAPTGSSTGLASSSMGSPSARRVASKSSGRDSYVWASRPPALMSSVRRTSGLLRRNAKRGAAPASCAHRTSPRTSSSRTPPSTSRRSSMLARASTPYTS